MSNSTAFYLYYDETAGAFIYLNTVPSWNDALQGYYNGNDRALFSMYKDVGGTLYQNKGILQHQSDLQYSQQMQWRLYYTNTSFVEDLLFDYLSPILGSVGNIMALHGVFHFSSLKATVTGAYWESTSIIRLMGQTDSNSLLFASIQNGGASNIDFIEIMGNFDAV